MKVHQIELGKSYKIQSSAVDETVPWVVIKSLPGPSGPRFKVRRAGAVRDRPGNNTTVPPERIIELWEDYANKREVWLKSLEDQRQMNHAISAHWHTFIEQLGRVFGDGVVAQAYPQMGLLFKTEEAIERMIGILSQQRDKGKPW